MALQSSKTSRTSLTLLWRTALPASSVSGALFMNEDISLSRKTDLVTLTIFCGYRILE